MLLKYENILAIIKEIKKGINLMKNRIENLFNDAVVFKKSHPEYSDLDLFFEFDAINKLDEYPNCDWGFIVKKLIKIFSFDEEGLCSIIVQDLLVSQKITQDVWERIFKSLQQTWKNKGVI